MAETLNQDLAWLAFNCAKRESLRLGVTEAQFNQTAKVVQKEYFRVRNLNPLRGLFDR